MDVNSLSPQQLDTLRQNLEQVTHTHHSLHTTTQRLLLLHLHRSSRVRVTDLLEHQPYALDRSRGVVSPYPCGTGCESVWPFIRPSQCGREAEATAPTNTRPLSRATAKLPDHHCHSGPLTGTVRVARVWLGLAGDWVPHQLAPATQGGPGEVLALGPVPRLADPGERRQAGAGSVVGHPLRPWKSCRGWQSAGRCGYWVLPRKGRWIDSRSPIPSIPPLQCIQPLQCCPLVRIHSVALLGG